MKKLTLRSRLGKCRHLAAIENTGRIPVPERTVSSIDPEWIEDRLYRLREGYEWI